ncbi:MAG: HEAT repeat domain-containing protein [Gemmataceae bacterium]
MKKNTFWSLALVAVLAAAVTAVWLDPTQAIRGYLQGDAFFAGRPVRYWRQALKSQDPAVQQEASRSLEQGGGAAMPVLVALLADSSADSWESAESRWRAADLLGKLGPEAADATPALLRALADDDLHVRTVAAASLGLVARKESAAEVVPGLNALVEAGGPASAAASRSLSKFGPRAETAVPPLVKALKAQDSEARWNAARTLGKIGPAAQRAVPALIEAMKDGDAKVREHAAEAVGDIGPAAKDAIPALTKALADENARVRRDAVRSLGQIGPAAKSALPAVEGLLKDADANVREAATRTQRILSGGPAPEKAS